MNWRHGIWIALCLLTWAVFWQTRDFGFLTIDDDGYVTRNVHVTSGLTFENIAWAFTTTYAANWHPFTWLSLMLDAQLWGVKPGAFHLMNVVLHTANVLLLYALLMRWTGAWGRSAFIAAMFAVHPLHVESVAWIAERKDVLSIFFGLLALLAYGEYARNRKAAWYIATCAAFVCSLLAKQMLVTFPFLLLLLDYWPLQRVLGSGLTPNDHFPCEQRSWRDLVREKWPLFALTVAFCVVASIAQREGGAVKPLGFYSVPVRLENAVLSYGLYLRNTFFPTELTVYYPHPRDSISHLAVILAGLVLLGVTVISWVHARLRPWIAVGWFWFLGTLVPVIGLVQIGDQQLADRYMYFPLIGITLAVTWSISADRYFVPACAVLLVLASTVLAWRQTALWQDDFTLLRHALRVTKKNVFAHNNLGAALLEQGRLTESLTHLEEAARLQPDSYASRRNLGMAYYKSQRLDEAEQHLRTSLDLQPDDGVANLYLGMILRTRGDLVNAEQHLFLAARLRPEDAEAQYHLALVYQARGDLPLAEEHLQKAAALQPNVPETFNDLGVVQARLGKREAATASFQQALRLDPSLQAAKANLQALTAPNP